MSETVHATAVLAGRHGVLLRGASGAGKSRLAAALIGQGARLIGDDRVHLSRRGGRLLVSPHGAVAGLLEMRGRGLLRLPFERAAVVALVVDIVPSDGIERLPETAELHVEACGVRLPRQPVPAGLEPALSLIGAALSAISGAAS